MTPDLQFSVLCDDVRREDNGKLMLIGLFEVIGGAAFPLNYPSMAVVNRWSNGEGEWRQKVRIVGAENQVLSETGAPVKLPDTMAHCTSVSLFRGVSFPRPGKYWVESLLDEDLKCRYPLVAVLVERPAGGPFPPPPHS